MLPVVKRKWNPKWPWWVCVCWGGELPVLRLSSPGVLAPPSRRCPVSARSPARIIFSAAWPLCSGWQPQRNRKRKQYTHAQACSWQVALNSRHFGLTFGSFGPWLKEFIMKMPYLINWVMMPRIKPSKAPHLRSLFAGDIKCERQHKWQRQPGPGQDRTARGCAVRDVA